jgi:hypothetical protein
MMTCSMHVSTSERWRKAYGGLGDGEDQRGDRAPSLGRLDCFSRLPDEDSWMGSLPITSRCSPGALLTGVGSCGNVVEVRRSQWCFSARR